MQEIPTQKYPHIVVAFAFGEPASISPNRRLATFAEQCALEHNSAPIVTQDDIAINDACEVIYVANKPHRPATTLMVARGAVQKAVETNAQAIWVVAARPHLWRCKRDLTKLLREAHHTIKVKVAPGITETPYRSWYDPHSVQKRTQSLIKGGWYEPLFRIIPFSIYKRVAG